VTSRKKEKRAAPRGLKGEKESQNQGEKTKKKLGK
jgi:hypothetical protein